MPSNCGATRLKRGRRSGNPMRDYDALPKDLRVWMASAKLPWRARSVQTAYQKALARTGDHGKALRELDRLQHMLVAKDASHVWGQGHPETQQH